MAARRAADGVANETQKYSTLPTSTYSGSQFNTDFFRGKGGLITPNSVITGNWMQF